jgi:hypothetical protein
MMSSLEVDAVIHTAATALHRWADEHMVQSILVSGLSMGYRNTIKNLVGQKEGKHANRKLPNVRHVAVSLAPTTFAAIFLFGAAGRARMIKLCGRTCRPYKCRQETIMNSNQRSEGNNQSNNGGNELDMNMARAGTAEGGKLNPATERGVGQAAGQSGSQQSGGQQSGSPGTERSDGVQSGTYQETGNQPSGAHQPGFQNVDQDNRLPGTLDGNRGGDHNINQQSGSMQSADRSGSQTGSNSQGEKGVRQGGTDDRQSNDAAGSYPMSPGGSRMSADDKMDDDTGLSNTANRPVDPEQGRQEEQSNVGRRSDGTPD